MSVHSAIQNITNNNKEALKKLQQLPRQSSVMLPEATAEVYDLLNSTYYWLLPC
jgi:hypothetical protein